MRKSVTFIYVIFILVVQYDIGIQAMISSSNMQEAVVSLWDWDPNVPGVQYDDFLGR